MRLIASLLAAVALALLPASAARAQEAMAAFEAACTSHPDFFSFAVTGLDAAGTGNLCGCLVREFSGYTEAELAILSKDIDGTATAADRTAFGDYTALELKARAAVDRCVAAAPPGAGADMADFRAACLGSPFLLDVIGGSIADATPRREALCTCLTDTLAPRLSTAEAAILARDLDGTATDAEREAHAGYPALAEMAGTVFDGCFAEIAPSP